MILFIYYFNDIMYNINDNKKKISLINYNFLLHFYDISNSIYKNLENIIFNFKNRNIHIKNILDDIEEDNYMYIIQNILNYDYISKGILSDRDLIKYLNIDEIFNLLNKKNIIVNNYSFTNIFDIDNKFIFFYEYFNWHTKFIKNKFIIHNNNNNINTAVIVETRNHVLLEHIIYNVMYNLGNTWNLHIFCGYNNYNYIINTFSNIKITLLPFYNLSVDLYDYIFMSNEFWNDIDTENILIFQTDTYLLDNPTNLLLNNNYPYIGALHTNIHNKVSYLTPKGIGYNGGLSFRKKSCMINCIDNISVDDINNYRNKHNLKPIIKTPYDYLDIYHENILFYDMNKTDILSINNNRDLIFEDVYFSHAIEMLNYPIPNTYIAKYLFIQENIYDKIKNIYGIHGWDKNYLDLDYQKFLFKKYTIKLLNNKNNKQINYKQYTNVLIITHNLGGGTEKYVMDVINLNNKVNYDIIRLKEYSNSKTILIYNNKNIILYKNQINNNFLINKYYDFIHIHYLNEPAGILIKFIDELMNKNISPKLIITLHDYHFIINSKENEYHLTIFNSNISYLDKLKNDKSLIELYKNYKNLFLKADLLLTGGFVCKIIYNYFFDLPYNLIKVVLHPEIKYFEPIINDYTELNFNTLNIGLIGSISVSKGAHISNDVSLIIKNNNCKIFHFGYGFHKKNNSNINHIGSYNDEKHLRELLISHNINLLWFPAFRHESYCYTLTLAIQTNLPILAFDSGTFRERLSTYNGAYEIHTNDYKADILYNDIIDFWNVLKNKSYNNKINEKYKYDYINYQELYL